MSVQRIAAIGEAMIELSLDTHDTGTAQIGVAGDTLNTAIYLKRRAPQIDVSFVTCLGDDALSDRIQHAIAAERISTELIGRIKGRSAGLYAISTDANGERSFSYWREASAARAMFDGHAPALNDLADFDVLYLSAITLAILSPAARESLRNWLAGYRARGGQVAFDSNYRPSLWCDGETARREIAALWQLTDIALPSLEDEQALFGDTDAAAVIARLRDAGCSRGALKCGAAGPIPLDGQITGITFPSASIVIDTTAAGDSFNGGYLAALLAGQSHNDCLIAGHSLAIEVLGVKGAILPAQR